MREHLERTLEIGSIRLPSSPPILFTLRASLRAVNQASTSRAKDAHRRAKGDDGPALSTRPALGRRRFALRAS